MSRAASLADRFRSLTGRPPAGVWSAPGRVNLIGEHTDYNDGFVLPLAIGRSTLAAVGRRADGRVRAWSQERGPAAELALDDIAPGRVEGWAAYAYGVVWALRQSGVDVPGVDLLVTSDVPPGAGLSSSAALTVAVTVALRDLLGVDVDVPLVAQRAETEVAGTPCGLMDQTIAVHGRAGHVVLIDMQDRSVEPIPLGLEAAGLSLLVIDTRVKHALNDGAYAERRRQCAAAAAALGERSLRHVPPALPGLSGTLLRRARHVVTEDERTLSVAGHLRGGGVARIGNLLLGSHASLRDDFEVSCAELDVAVDAAMSGGALGARMTGGGFGGSAIALVPTAAEDDVEHAVARAFAERHWQGPGVFRVSPSPGARREQ